jgi:hypothetical protein
MPTKDVDSSIRGVKNVRIGSRMTIDREEYTAGASG